MILSRHRRAARNATLGPIMSHRRAILIEIAGTSPAMTYKRRAANGSPEPQE
jgi:hypothetical protein